jgi:rare lipoprotein A
MREWLVYVAVALSLIGFVFLYQSLRPYDEVGIASWYGPGFHGKRTANGEIYDMHGISAAHKTLPFGSIVQVVEIETGRSVVVPINDRGPFIEGRIIDLSKGAATELGIVEKGITRVGLRILRWPSE